MNGKKDDEHKKIPAKRVMAVSGAPLYYKINSEGILCYLLNCSKEELTNKSTAELTSVGWDYWDKMRKMTQTAVKYFCNNRAVIKVQTWHSKDIEHCGITTIKPGNTEYAVWPDLNMAYNFFIDDRYAGIITYDENCSFNVIKYKPEEGVIELMTAKVLTPGGESKIAVNKNYNPYVLYESQNYSRKPNIWCEIFPAGRTQQRRTQYLTRSTNNPDALAYYIPK